MNFSTRRGFTIWEILIIVIIVSVGLLSVVVVLINGMKYIQKTRQKVIALNLAREGMEAVYQIRDTNWIRRGGVTDQCWLKRDPLVDEFSSKCVDDLWIMSGSYVLQRLFTGGQEYFALTGPRTGLDLGNGLDSDDLYFSLCQKSGYWDACIGVDVINSEGRYFREIQGLGLFLKDEMLTGGKEILCTGGLSPGCGDGRAKEFRFCSRVAYLGEGTGEVKFCGVLTNFEGKNVDLF